MIQGVCFYGCFAIRFDFRCRPHSLRVVRGNPSTSAEMIAEQVQHPATAVGGPTRCLRFLLVCGFSRGRVLCRRLETGTTALWRRVPLDPSTDRASARDLGADAAPGSTVGHVPLQFGCRAKPWLDRHRWGYAPPSQELVNYPQCLHLAVFSWLLSSSTRAIAGVCGWIDTLRFDVVPVFVTLLPPSWPHHPRPTFGTTGHRRYLRPRNPWESADQEHPRH
jgi:hypothetical protein